LIFVHEKLLEAINPQLFNHFQKQGVCAPLYTTKWYLTAFLDIFSYDVTLRIWDLLFLDGYDILFSVAIGILSMFAADLLLMKFDKIMGLLHTLDKETIDINQFIAYVIDHHISSRTIRKYERMYLVENNITNINVGEGGIIMRTFSASSSGSSDPIK